MRRIAAIALMPLVPALLSGCSQVAQSTAAANEAGRIVAAAQPAGGALLVGEVGLPSTGWVVVHAVRDGSPDFTGSIGHAYVPAGPSTNVSVPLDPAPGPGERVVVMLHLDTGAPRIFEFANGGLEKHDMPVLKDGKPVMTEVTLN